MTIRFISDLHLDATRPHILRAFLHYLDDSISQAQSLYILGDFFEAWVGDDNTEDELNQSVESALKAATDKGLSINIMHGNRDFLIGQDFCRRTGCILLEDPTILELHGSRYLLMHGDSLCTDDTAYQEFKAQIRQPAMIEMLLAKPLDERKALAVQLRQQSAEANSNKAEDIMDVNQQAVLDAFSEYKVDAIIHGHTHRPDIHSIDNKQRIVLGDWDSKAWHIELDNNGAKLSSFAIEH